VCRQRRRRGRARPVLSTPLRSGAPTPAPPRPPAPPARQLDAFESLSPPTAPVYDAGEWVNTQFPRYGYAARGPLYSWRDWAAAALPRADAEAYLAVEALMADDEQRGGLVRQAQWVRRRRLWRGGG
jgi:hypothetical protein